MPIVATPLEATSVLVRTDTTATESGANGRHQFMFQVFMAADGHYILLRYVYIPGMWSRCRRLGLETVSRRINVSSRSRLDQSAQRLGLVSVSDLCVSDHVSVSTQNVSGLVEGLGPFRLVETFHAGAPNLTTIVQ